MSMHERVMQTAGARSGLSAARLRYQVQKLLRSAVSSAGKSQTELANLLGVRKSAVSQVLSGGNLRLNTVAEYLDAVDLELQVDVVPAGTMRSRSLKPSTCRPQPVFAPPAAGQGWRDLDRSSAVELQRAVRARMPLFDANQEYAATSSKSDFTRAA